jgi:CelD/BcsL family acetyltransferase involved in cellulose biosynthesis
MYCELDPLTDPRWSEFLRHHGCASPFHTPGWLEALSKTYGFKPAVLMTSEPGGEVANGLVFCRVNTFLTGHRLVSVPFADFCEPLVRDCDDFESLAAEMSERAKAENCNYVELRPTAKYERIPSAFQRSQSFYLHRLDLRKGATALFHAFHKDCIQRKIRRAEREAIRITRTTDSKTLDEFYGLMLQTRRRHGLPPQPLAWFRNIIACLRESTTIYCAYKDAQPIAAMMTLRHGKTVYYKYGASDAQFHKYGGMPYLLWSVIQDSLRAGFEVLDMGRSDLDNPGLVAFKEHWGAARSTLSYWRSPAQAPQPLTENRLGRKFARVVCRSLPDRYLSAVGTLLYRHIA